MYFTVEIQYNEPLNKSGIHYIGISVETPLFNNISIVNTFTKQIRLLIQWLIILGRYIGWPLYWTSAVVLFLN